MNRIIGDRKEKSALDEMEEVARARNRDVAEEDRLEALRKAKEEADRRKQEDERRAREETEKVEAPSEPVIIPEGKIIPGDYHGLKWELHAPKHPMGGKNALTYDGSLARIREAGFERHPAPSETVSLMADYLEEKLQGKLNIVADEMLSGCGDWLSMAMERNGNILICYLHPEGLVWDEGKGIYVQNGFKYYSKQYFNISGKESNKDVGLNEFGDGFVNLFYGRSFNELPKEMREGDKKANISLPRDKEVWPVSYHHLSNIISYPIASAASRGININRIAGMKILKPGTERMSI